MNNKNQLSNLESIVLEWVSYDYEKIQYIRGNISSDYGENVTPSNIHRTLQGLQSKGLVDSFYYSSQNGKFIKQKPIGEFPEKDIYWYASGKL